MNEQEKQIELKRLIADAKGNVSNEVIPLLKEVILNLESAKSTDRNPRDRYIAIAVTETEKLIAFVSMFL